MGGGGGTTTTSGQSTQTTDTGPWSAQQGYLKDLFANAQHLYQTDPLTPFPNATVSPFNPTQTQAIGQIGNLGLSPQGSQPTTAASNYLTNLESGGNLSPLTNPYLSGMYNAAAQGLTNQYQTATAPNTQSMFESAGRFGSGSANQAQNQNQLALGTSLGNLASNIYGNAYNTGTQQMLGGAAIAPSVAQGQYIGPEMALSAGTQAQQQAQAQLGGQIQQWQAAQMDPWQTLGLYQGGISGNYGQSGQTSQQYTQQVPYYSNPVGSALGGGLGILGALGSLATPGFGGASALGNIFSDIRLKDDIKPIGKTYTGQNLYSYRYKGSAVPQIGLMAQEVEQYDPEAVSIDPFTGFKMVNYDKALGWRAFDAAV